MNLAYVTRTATDSYPSHGDYEVTITVIRHFSPPYDYYPRPRAQDIPQDVRDALRAWLDTADA